jgi:hypothetical protein
MHHAEARLCRWLQRLHELAGSEFFLTARGYCRSPSSAGRPTVSTAAHKLQEDGLMSYQRGQITLVDVEGLRHHACECFYAAKEYERAVFG